MVQQPAWYPDELESAGGEHLDPEFVAGYDRKAQFDPAEDVQALTKYGLNRDHTLIDLGAGTGVFAVAAAQLCKRVIAVEIAPAMVEVLTARVRTAGVDNVDVVRGGLLSYQHDAEPVDFIYSRNVLHHLPDFWKAIALVRIAGMLKPGGTLRLHDLVYSFDPHEAPVMLERWFSNAVEHPEQGYTRADYETHVRTEHSTFSWLLEPMLERAGFEIHTAEHRGSGTYSVYDCRRR